MTEHLNARAQMTVAPAGRARVDAGGIEGRVEALANAEYKVRGATSLAEKRCLQLSISHPQACGSCTQRGVLYPLHRGACAAVEKEERQDVCPAYASVLRTAVYCKAWIPFSNQHC